MPPLDYRIDQFTLDNGLRVVVNEDHSVPTVAVNLWVGVGSRHEAPGKTGLAHLFEHLMFQGSRNVASGEHFAVLMGQGGRLNATTWFDRTNFFETLPRGAYELALWMEADRHGHLLDALTQENLDNQRDVVKEEKRQRYDNVPYGHALATLCATAFPAGHPYHHPTIGSMEDLDSATLEDVHAFFRRYYRPSNTVLTLVGDVGAGEGFEAAQRYFGWLEDAPVPQPDSSPPLGPLPGAVRVESDQVVPTARLYFGFRLPVDNTPDYLAAASALDIVGGLVTSRLDKRLVRSDEVAHSVSAGTMGLIDGNSLGTLAIEVVDAAGLTEVEDAVCAELVRFAADGPTDVELETVRAQTERSWLSALAAMEDRADYLGHFATLFEDPNGVNDYLDRAAAVGPRDVVAAARHWLTPDARATVAYPMVAAATVAGDDVAGSTAGQLQ
ncbi:MAG TPA: pitrilysin family protein [Dermatophilaceae bacterium]|nr:pitrilysin family protein [Dermatophilaceae bacterium]